MRLFLFLTGFLYSYSTLTLIPKNAPPLIPTLYEEVETIMGDFALYAYFPALIEQESCISLTWKRCWNAKSRLYAKRKTGGKEEGAGLPQLTRVWKPNGRIRFDTLTSLVRKYPRQLKGLSWKNVYDRPDLQLKAMVLLWNDNYKRVKFSFGKGMNEIEIIAFADSAYNGGFGGLRKDIQRCAVTKGCDPKKWFGNVEYTCTKSKRKLYGDRSACDINREHVRTIFFKRLLKYHQWSINNIDDFRMKD